MVFPLFISFPWFRLVFALFAVVVRCCMLFWRVRCFVHSVLCALWLTGCLCPISNCVLCGHCAVVCSYCVGTMVFVRYVTYSSCCNDTVTSCSILFLLFGVFCVICHVCLCLCIDLVCSLTCRRAEVLKPQKRVTACWQRVAIAAWPCQRKNHKAKTTEAHKFKRVSVTNIIQHHLVTY